MSYTSRFPSSSSFSRRYSSRRYRATGTRFQARKFSSRVTGREVPYYLGPGREAHVLDSSVLMNFTTSIDGNSASATSASLNTFLNPITRGTGIFDRESQRASMKYVLLRLRFSLLSPNDAGVISPGFVLATYPVTVRVILVYSTNAIASITPANLLDVPGDTSIFNGHWAASAVQRIDTREQHQILYDNKFVLRNTDGTPATTDMAHPRIPAVTGDFTFKDLDLRLPVNRPVTFTSTSVSPISLSDITSGALHLMVIADSLYHESANRIDFQVLGSARLVFAP